MDYCLFLGLNDKDSKQQKYDIIEAYKIVSNILLNNGVDGATISTAQGIYKHDDGSIVFEQSLKIEIALVDDINIINNIIDILKVVFNQESIALQEIHGKFFIK